MSKDHVSPKISSAMLMGHPDRRECVFRLFIHRKLADNLPIASHRDMTCKIQVTNALPRGE